MTLWRFAAILAAYGADPARWPTAERDHCRAFLMQSVRARVLLAEASAVDALIAESRPADVAPRDLRARIARRIARLPASAPRTIHGWAADQLGALAPAAMAAAVVLAIGVGWIASAPRVSHVSAFGGFQAGPLVGMVL